MNENNLDSLIEKYTTELINMGVRFNHPFSETDTADKRDGDTSSEENFNQGDVQDVSEEDDDEEEKEQPPEENLYSRELFSDENVLREQIDATTDTPEKEVPAVNPENYALFRAVVFTAGEAYPVENAKVVVKKNGEIHAFLSTNASGETKTVSLESYPEENSLNPDSKQQYMAYTADIHADGFESLSDLPVEAVGGSQILLQENLIPIGGSL